MNLGAEADDGLEAAFEPRFAARVEVLSCMRAACRCFAPISPLYTAARGPPWEADDSVSPNCFEYARPALFFARERFREARRDSLRRMESFCAGSSSQPSSARRVSVPLRARRASPIPRPADVPRPAFAPRSDGNPYRSATDASARTARLPKDEAAVVSGNASDAKRREVAVGREVAGVKPEKAPTRSREVVETKDAGRCERFSWRYEERVLEACSEFGRVRTPCLTSSNERIFVCLAKRNALLYASWFVTGVCNAGSSVQHSILGMILPPMQKPATYLHSFETRR